MVAPFVHNTGFHPEIHARQDATPIVARPPVLYNEGTESIEITSESSISESLHQVITRDKIAIMLLLLE